MSAHITIELARGTPSFTGNLYALWVIYGRDPFHTAVLPGLLIPLAQLITSPVTREE
ncbi:hypothetical protein [Amycolatopsis coloradensis]|uniref:hypothetical protein n=1 Tax=Amycolatopsis coloradensis TaxID=76021 RepID=UPI0013013C76|nr:hypothetical protein [Amycolatopsis coloradensis]